MTETTKLLPGTPKLTADQVREIIAVRAAFNHKRAPAGHEANLQTLAEKYGVTKACISRICHGHGWTKMRKEEGLPFVEREPKKRGPKAKVAA